MPNAMQDMASGSDAVLQLQRNVAAAPDVQQHQKNIMQEEALRIDQEKATLGKTMMENTIRQSDFQASQDAVQKMQQLSGTPEYKNATQSEQSKQIAQLWSSMGKPVEAESAMKQAESLQLMEYNNKIKEFDAQSRAIQNAASVIGNMLPDRVKDAVEALPPPARKALIDSIGPANYAKMDGTQVQKAASELMWSTSGKLGEMKLQTMQTIAQNRLAEIQARILSEERISIARVAAGVAKGAGKEETRLEKEWKDYRTEAVSLDKDFLSTDKELEKDIEIAKTEAKATAPGPVSRAFSGITGGATETPEQKKLAQLVQDRLDKQKAYWDDKVSLAKHSGDKDEYARVQAAYAKSYPKEAPDPGKDTPPPADAAPKDKPAAPAATSNKSAAKDMSAEDKASTIKAAQEAIAKGKDPKAVAARLKELGLELPSAAAPTISKEKSRGELLQEKVAAERKVAAEKEKTRMAKVEAEQALQDKKDAEEERKKRDRSIATRRALGIDKLDSLVR